MKDVIERLRALEQGAEPYVRVCGVCMDLSKRVCYRFNKTDIHEACRNWEHYSGDSLYPIAPLGRGIAANLAYRRIEDLWIGEYGRRRREFCAIMADYLENQMESKNES